MRSISVFIAVISPQFYPCLFALRMRSLNNILHIHIVRDRKNLHVLIYTCGASVHLSQNMAVIQKYFIIMGIAIKVPRDVVILTTATIIRIRVILLRKKP